jgi:4-amino-4-deoxy-L-arabinose transferase-like glycosyltransferase
VTDLGKVSDTFRKCLPAALAVLPMALAVAARMAGPDSLDTNDQAKHALYVLDVWESGRWILPRSLETQPATKPPLYHWLAVLVSLPAGGPTETACRLTSALASLALAWLTFRIGRERWGLAAGIGAAWALAACHPAFKLSIQVRPDAVLAVLAAASLLALAKIEGGRPRGMAALFWSALALSVLAKGFPGPLVILGGLAGFCLFVPARRTVAGVLFRSPWILALAVPLAWFALAVAVGGRDYLEGVVLKEFLDRAPSAGGFKWKNFPGQILFIFLGRCAPWSILAALAAGWAIRRRKDGAARDLLLPAAWLLGAIAPFCFFRGQREDYLLPVLPAASLLAAAGVLCGRPAFASRAWRILAGAAAAAALILAIPTLSGLPDRFPSIAKATSDGGPVWGAGLLAGAFLLGLAALSGRPREGALPLRPFLFSAAGVLAILIGYGLTIAPEIRDGTEEGMKEIAARIVAERGPGDEVLLVGAVSNHVRFLARIDFPAVPIEAVGGALEGLPAGRRLLVLADAKGAAAVMEALPGRFEEIHRSPDIFGKPRQVLLLTRS